MGGEMQHTSRLRESFGTVLITVGLSMLLWLAATELKPPAPPQRKAVATKESLEKKSVDSAKNNRLNVEPLPLGDFPASIKTASSDILRAYKFSSDAKNHGVLNAQTCYCGCDRGQGHENLLDCYIKELFGNKAIYDEHALFCQMCVSEVRDVEKWLSEGKAADQIKVLIDEKYGGP